MQELPDAAPGLRARRARGGDTHRRGRGRRSRRAGRRGRDRRGAASEPAYDAPPPEVDAPRPSRTRRRRSTWRRCSPRPPPTTRTRGRSSRAVTGARRRAGAGTASRGRRRSTPTRPDRSPPRRRSTPRVRVGAWTCRRPRSRPTASSRPQHAVVPAAPRRAAVPLADPRAAGRRLGLRAPRWSAGITDWLDGKIARATGRSAGSGQLLDPLADRALHRRHPPRPGDPRHHPVVARDRAAGTRPRGRVRPGCCSSVAASPDCRCTSSARPRRSACSTPSRCCSSAPTPTARGITFADVARVRRLGVRDLGHGAVLVGRACSTSSRPDGSCATRCRDGPFDHRPRGLDGAAARPRCATTSVSSTPRPPSAAPPGRTKPGRGAHAGRSRCSCSPRAVVAGVLRSSVAQRQGRRPGVAGGARRRSSSA